MDDTLCQKFDVLRYYLTDELGGTAKFEFKQITNFKKYCPSENCNTDLEKITIGFLWLLEHCYSISKDRNYNENNTNTFFLYIILWLSYKLNQITGLKFTKINDFYTNQVNNSGKYSEFISDSSKFTDLNGFIDKQKDLLNINIEDLSKFYDASKLICSMYGKIAQNKTVDTLLNAASFVSKYKELNNYNIEDTARSKIFFVLSTDYNNLKNECKGAQCRNFPTFQR